MAEDLGDIASLLGSSFVQTAAMNEDEQNEYRKRAMRQQLLYAFAAPLAQQAGQQLGQGVIDLAGNLFLGDKSKNFFERQEGASLQKRLFDMSKQSEKFDETDKVYLKLEIPSQRIGTYDTELVKEFFVALVNNSGLTLH